MSEPLISRINRLISGAVYGQVEALESAMAETTMREAIREVERTTEEVRDQLFNSRREQQVAARRIIQTQEKLAQLADKVEAALKVDRDDLAEAVVNRQLDLEAQIPILEKTRDAAGERGAELNGYITALNGRKSEMEEELKAFIQAQKELSNVAVDGDLGGETCGLQKRAEKAEKAFSRVVENATGVTGMTRSDRDTMSKLIELESVQRKEKVAERMKAYKEKRGQSASA